MFQTKIGLRPECFLMFKRVNGGKPRECLNDFTVSAFSQSKALAFFLSNFRSSIHGYGRQSASSLYLQAFYVNIGSRFTFLKRFNLPCERLSIIFWSLISINYSHHKKFGVSHSASTELTYANGISNLFNQWLWARHKLMLTSNKLKFLFKFCFMNLFACSAASVCGILHQ